MVSVSALTILKKFKNDLESSKGQPGGLATLDSEGKVELTQAPPALINGYNESLITDPAEINSVLVSTIAWEGWMMGFPELGRTFFLKQNPYTEISNWKEIKTVAENTLKINGKTEAQIKAEARDEAIPIGFPYTEVPDSTGFFHRLPGDTLYDFTGNLCDYSSLGFASQAAFDAAKSNCAYPGTTWKMSIKSANFKRQAGTRTDNNGKTIGGTFGTEQEHQFQGFQIGATADGSGSIDRYCFANARDWSSSESIGPRAGNTSYEMSSASQGVVNKLKAVNDGTNGNPNTGVETRPAVTIVREWVRIA